jgi:hypothetical protein
MSKKVLKIAGRRPMLLALIMATITIGLLFSGWLAPTPGRAQTGGGNPPPGGENTNCPNYIYSTNVTCPSVSNNRAIAPTTFCVNEGTSLPLPQLVTSPAASTGSIIITTTETCSNIVISTTNPVTYSFSGLAGC